MVGSETDPAGKFFVSYLFVKIPLLSLLFSVLSLLFSVFNDRTLMIQIELICADKSIDG